MLRTTMNTAFQLYESQDAWDVGTLQHIYRKTSEPTATIKTTTKQDLSPAPTHPIDNRHPSANMARHLCNH